MAREIMNIDGFPGCGRGNVPICQQFDLGQNKLIIP
jgi:hypothetical protein